MRYFSDKTYVDRTFAVVLLRLCITGQQPQPAD